MPAPGHHWIRPQNLSDLNPTPSPATQDPLPLSIELGFPKPIQGRKGTNEGGSRSRSNGGEEQQSAPGSALKALLPRKPSRGRQATRARHARPQTPSRRRRRRLRDRRFGTETETSHRRYSPEPISGKGEGLPRSDGGGQREAGARGAVELPRGPRRGSCQWEREGVHRDGLAPWRRRSSHRRSRGSGGGRHVRLSAVRNLQ